MTAVADCLKDAKRMQEWLTPRAATSQLSALLKRCADLAAPTSCNHFTTETKAIDLIQKVIVIK
jgi:hypothetical protein